MTYRSLVPHAHPGVKLHGLPADESAERWSESGLTGAEFAAEIGVKEATLRHWKWALQRHATRPGWEAKVARERRRQGRADFVELVAPAAPPPAPAEQVELVLRNGLKIRFPALVDSEALRRRADNRSPARKVQMKPV